MFVELFQNCLLRYEFGASIYIEEYALEALFCVQLISWPFSATILLRNAIDSLLILRQEELREPSNLFVIFLAQGMLDNCIEVQKYFAKYIMPDLRRDDIGHLILILVQLDAHEIIELNLTVNAEQYFMLTLMISSLQRELFSIIK